MKKLYPLFTSTILFTGILISCKEHRHRMTLNEYLGNEGIEDEGYDGPAQRDSLEFEKVKDPALGYVPSHRLMEAIDYT